MTRDEAVKEKQLCREDYRKPYPVVRGKSSLACIVPGFEIAEVRVMGAGRVSRGDVELEYVDARFYTREKTR